jgi:hypothetical protein
VTLSACTGRIGLDSVQVIEPRAAAASTQWIDRMSHFLCITTANQRAVDVGLAARLAIRRKGYLAVRGMQDPAPYLASGHFL